MNVQSGTLNLSGNGTDVDASYTGAGTIQFSGTTRTLDAASSVTVANAIFSSGTTTVNGTYNVSGTTTVNGGTATLAGTLSGLGNALIVSSGTLSLNTSNASVATLTQSGGSLNGSGTLTVSGLSTLSGGRESGGGTTIAAGGAAFSSTGFSLDGGRTLQLGGTSTATGASVQIQLNGGTDPGSGILTIGSGATFNDQTTSSGLSIIANNFGGTDTGTTAVMNNLGTFTKSGSAATSTIGTTFNNSGIVNVQSGTLNLSGNGTDVGASYTGTGTIQFSGGIRTLDAASSITAVNATFSGATTTISGTYNVSGTTTVSGGTATLAGTLSSLGNALTISSGTLSLNTSNATVGTLTQSGGTLLGTGTLTVSGLSTLSGGRESGGGTTLAAGGAAFSLTNFSLDGGRTLQLGGTSTATGTDVQIQLNGSTDPGSGILTIGSGATFNDQTTSSGLNIIASNFGSTDNGATAVMNNLGTFTKSGSAVTSTISAIFNNSGTVNVQSGTLNLSGGGTDVGASYTGAGTIQFGGGTRTLDAASSITAANATFSNGTTTINGSFSDPGLATLNSGTLTLSGALTVGSMNETGGVLNGAGTLTVSGLSTLSGGRESGGGTTIAQGGAAFSSTGFALDGGRTLQLGGTSSTATGTNVNIQLNGGSDPGSGILTIGSGATFNDQTTSSGLSIFASSFGGTDTGLTAVMNNQGTFTKSGSAATSTISTTFNNSGTVNVQSGTLNLSGGGTDVGGSYAGAGTVQFSGTTRTLDSTSSISAANAIFSAGTTTINGTFSDPGLITINGGTMTLSVPLTVGALTESAGLLTGAGALTVSGSSTLSGGRESGAGTTIAQGGAAFTSGFSLDGGRTLQLGGASTATGTSVQIELNGGTDPGCGILTIASGATFNDQTTSSGLSVFASSRTGTDNGATAVMNNQGTLTKSGSAATSTISTTFNNRGYRRIVQNGTLNLSGGGTISGTFNLAVGAFVQFSSAFVLNGVTAFLGGTLSGSGSLTIGNGANVELSSSIAGLPISFSSGNSILTLDNPSTFQSPIAGLALGDTINLAGIAVASAVINGSTLNITETNNQTLSYQVSGAISADKFSIISGPAGSRLVLLVPNTGTLETGTKAAGTLSFNPTSTQLYQLVGATVSGSGGHGFLVQSTDSTPADSTIAEFDSASSISVTGTNFNGIDLVTAGAGIFVFNAASLSSAHWGIGAFNTGSGDITIASSGQIISGSSGINANDQATAIPVSANSVITVSVSGAINSGTVLNSSGSQPSGIVAGYLGGSTSTANLNVNGTVIVNNAANITAAAGWGIEAYNFGNGNVTVNDASGTTVTGAQYGIAAYAESGGTGDVAINVASGATINAGSVYGIFGFNSGAGSISITTAPGDIISGLSGSTGSSGIDAINEATAISASLNSSIVVSAYGTINSGTAPTGSGSPPAGISAGYFGGTTAPANPPLTGLNGSVLVNNFANITAAAGDGIRAFNYGIGNITVDDNSGSISALGGASPTNGYGVGIGAYNYGTGNISVSTAAGITINSGSSGIAAVNEAPAAPSTSSVSVIAYGTITPGTIPTGNGSPAAGILAGYNFNNSADINVAGSLIIDDYASISAPNGTDGIRGFNYGTGDITIAAEAVATISGGRYGIDASGHDGGNAQINNSAMVSGQSAGIFAQTTGASTISIVNSSTGVVENSGNSSSPAISISDNPTGSAVINNFGMIEANQNSAAGLAILEVGGIVTINNSAQIIGDVNLSNAIFNNNAGADWEIAGTNTFASGINVINNAGTINSQGSLTTIQITTGSLDIVGSINGTVNLAIGDGATLELNAPSSAGETVTFMSTQGTLKLDHSLTSPFIGQISSLTGTAVIHDNIDLADLAWNATASALYTANTGTSGILTVNDGNGHVETFNLINYTGAGSFSVQNDGQGGTLVFDPPVTTVTSAIASSATMETGADVQVPLLLGVKGSGADADSRPYREFSSSVESDFGDSGHVGKLSADLVTNLNGLARQQFSFEHASSGQTVASQNLLELKHAGGLSSNTATQQVTLLGPGDTFEFKPGMGTANPAHIPDYAGGKVGMEHAVIANFAELQALMPPNQSVHDTLLNLGHGEVFATAHVPPGQLHAEGFLLS